MQIRNGVEVLDSPVILTPSIENGTMTGTTISGGTATPSVLGSPEKTPVNAVAANGVVTFTGTPVADETITIGSQVFTFVAARSGAGSFEITINADNATQGDNLVAALADVSNVTGVNSTGAVTITAATKGVSGNLIVLSTSATGAAVTGVTDGKLDGGVDGTTGIANETCTDASYLYHCVAANGITGTNWRRIELGSAY